MHIRKILLGTVAAAAMSVSAHAAPLNGTASVSNVGVSGPALLAAGQAYTLGTTFNVVGGASDDLAPFNGTTFGPITFTATAGQTFSFDSANGDFTGSVVTVLGTSSALSRTLDVYVLGTFTPEGATLGAGPFTPGPASVTIAFSQTGPSGSVISSSFTLASPPAPPPGVPAPAALALFGLALAGLGVAARARKA